MKYQFTTHTTAKELWLLTMYSTYRSIAGLCNLVFTVAMIFTAIRFWESGNEVVKLILILLCCIFPVIQPLGFYSQAKTRAAAAKDVELSFNDAGIHVKVEKQTSDIAWQTIRKVMRYPGMLVIYSSGSHGFVLTNNVLGKDKKDFYQYVSAKIEISKAN